MGRWKATAIAIVVAFALSMFSGHVFYLMEGDVRFSPSPAGLEYYPSVRVVSERTVVPSGEVKIGKVEGEVIEAPQGLTVYTGQERLISYTGSISLLIPRVGLKRV